jgi:Stage II sporulation protein E (SpoIIE).
MTMAVNSIFNHVVEDICSDNPAAILSHMNKMIKNTLKSRSEKNAIDDGLDIGIVYLPKNNSAVFAGAKLSLYIKEEQGIRFIKGENKGIGYRNTADIYEFKNHVIDINQQCTFYISTDGFLDQNGGEKDYPFGRKRFTEIILNCSSESLSNQKDIFEKELKLYMKEEAQRDDITVLAFKAKGIE